MSQSCKATLDSLESARKLLAQMGFVPPKAPAVRTERDAWEEKQFRAFLESESYTFKRPNRLAWLLWFAFILWALSTVASIAHAQTTVRIWIDPKCSSHGYTHAQVVEGIKLGCEGWSSRCNVKFDFVTDSSKATLRVTTAELYRPDLGKGVHVRGQHQGNSIQLHNGKIAPGHSIHGTRQWKAYSSLDAMARIFGHELGHDFGWGHSSSPKCLMHSNASYWHCPAEVKRAQKQFGKPKAALAERLAAEAKPVEGLEAKP